MSNRNYDYGEKYCSCVFKVTAQGRTANPYAVCQASIFNRRGRKGPGAARCIYDRRYLLDKPYKMLHGYAVEKDLIDPDSKPQKNYLVMAIIRFFEQEGKLMK